jgi:hypothetical protein
MDRGRDRRRLNEQADNRITLGQLAASVAYHYHLTPQQVAEFSLPQLMLWHERRGIETGYGKLLDLEVLLVPHTENPDRTLRNLRANLLKMAGE